MKRQLTKEEAQQLTEKIVNTIKEFCEDLPIQVCPVAYKCSEHGPSPAFFPSISIVNDKKRVGYIEINFR